MLRFLCLLSILMVIWTGTHDAHASDGDYRQKLFGHEVKVSGSGQAQMLIVDGKQLLSDVAVFIERPEQIDGTGVLIGSSWEGGAVCDPSPFVLALPKQGPVRLDQPIDQCGVGDMKILPNAIEFNERAWPNKPGRRYSWTLAKGFTELDPVVFTPDPILGWENLKRGNVEQPLNIYKYAPVAATLQSLTGPDDPTFTNGFSGPSSGQVVGEIYQGSGCVAHNCAGNGSFVILQIDKRVAYLAWKEEDKPFVVRPKVSAWPSDFRKKLKAWTETLIGAPASP